MEADASPENEVRAILERFRCLDASHASLKEQLNVLIEEELGDERSPDSGEFGLDFGWGRVPGYFSEKGPARNALEHMGHAVHVWTASSGKIVYWNHSAEKLYGWKAFEAIGQRVADLLINEEHFTSIKKTLELLSSGCTWSGQFSFKKRSGETFMALVTESPLYENGELLGVITVSSDAAVFNGISSEELREYHDLHDGGPRILQSNLKDWHPKPQSVSVPQIAPTVSQLASKVKLWRHEDDGCNACTTPKQKEEMGPEDGDDMKEKPERAGKFLAQIQIGGIGDHAKENNQSAERNDSEDCLNSDSNKVKNKLMFTRGSEAAPSCQCKVRNRGTTRKRIPPKADTSGRFIKLGHRYQNSLEECQECLSLQKFSPLDAKGLMGDFQNFEVLGIENDAQQPVVKQRSSSGESMDDSHLSSSGKGGNNELNLKVNCEVCWEELHLKKQIGKGSCAVVYRGIWNGSDVAVKVYSADEYHKGTSPEYVKEISIMRRLRHPNVLLFMGAVCSQERLAIVTEFLPRGSLFRTLHKNSQGLDIRRRLRMALDVAKGMNYLHCRNPPIVHRDLKSSNLLVDKNWTVKVGDFGLSKLKKRTFLTTNSGRGTPQWMAPEVLRNEPSNEKSDVFSFGVILWELMTLSIPWISLNPLQVVGVVGFMDRRLDVPGGLNPEVSKLIHDCWRSDPGQRPPFKDIIQRMTDITQQSSQS